MYPSYSIVDADVIIIGAGISGMAAAFDILEHEPTLNIFILEASDHVGGRTLSIPLLVGDRNQIETFDLGGQFVSKSQTNMLHLLDKLNIELVENYVIRGRTIGELIQGQIESCSSESLSFGTLFEKIEFTMFLKKIEKMSGELTLSNPISILNSVELDLMSMETFIVNNLKSGVCQNLMRNIIRTTCGLEATEFSVLFYLAFCNGTEGITNQYMRSQGGSKEKWIRGGAQQICLKIASKIGWNYIKVNSPVIKIIRTKEVVLLETSELIYSCKYAIIAIPPEELLDVYFEPPLPKVRRDVLEKIRHGRMTKFVVTYKTAFWRAKKCSGDILTCGWEFLSGPIHLCHDVTVQNKPALMGYIASIDAFSTSKPKFEKQVLIHLCKYFGEEALQPVQYVEKSWIEEPYIGGCPMACPGIGTMRQYHEIRRPIGRLFWAGTETATSWYGYMCGAVQAGYRASTELLYEIRPQSLTAQDITRIQSKKTPQADRITRSFLGYFTNYKYQLAIALIVLYITIKIRKKLK